MTYGRASTQIRFSDCPPMFTTRPYLENVPFFGNVSGQPPGLHYQEPEVRRRDVGMQRYGQKIATTGNASINQYGLASKKNESKQYFKTSNGDVGLSIESKPDLGYLPTADAIYFLKHQYVGSRQPDPPTRFFTK